MAKVGIYGASGYTGAELLRLCAAHPNLEVVVATGDTQVGTPVASLYPSLAPAYGDLAFAESSPAAVDGVDLLFLGLPHGKAQEVVPALRGRVGAVVDLSADFRLKDASLYPRWYGEEHRCPELLAEFTYGLPELFRDEIRRSRLVAAPGCYVTAASLALSPLVRAGAIEPAGVIVDAASGVSGAGRGLKHTSLFCTVDEDVTAYGPLAHRHTPGPEQVTGAQILFTPHLVPTNRGILATCYARPAAGAEPSTDSLLHLLSGAYDGEAFVVVSDRSPSTKATLGSNSCHLTARYDERTGTVLVLSALDNLTKGASGQAVQCANLVLGLPEAAGLPAVGVYP
jgi:N-acetyl-gamma-glutamyl-phosphate reductase